jgi:hypothetical protein
MASFADNEGSRALALPDKAFSIDCCADALQLNKATKDSMNGYFISEYGN